MTGEDRITREDLAEELRGVGGSSGGPVADRRASTTAVAVVVAVTLVVVVWFVGRRAGLRRSTVVEVRRL